MTLMKGAKIISFQPICIKEGDDNMGEEQPFWMVYVDGNRGSEFKHIAYEDARREAERLAQIPQNRGKRVYILLATEYVIVFDPVQHIKLFDPLPF